MKTIPTNVYRYSLFVYSMIWFTAINCHGVDQNLMPKHDERLQRMPLSNTEYLKYSFPSLDTWGTKWPLLGKQKKHF